MSTPPDGLVVVKVGGSLYDHPSLGLGLWEFLEAYPAKPIVMVSGGGRFADEIRRLDGIHSLGDRWSHFLALRSMTLSTAFLAAILETASGVFDFPDWLKWADCFNLVDTAEPEYPAPPHSWDVTSDSLAAWVARGWQAARLILLKSIDIPPGTPWSEAAAKGWVDGYFPTAVAEAAFPIEVVNFRRWLDERYPTEPTEA